MYIFYLIQRVNFVNLNFSRMKTVYYLPFLSYSFSKQIHIWGIFFFLLKNVPNKNIAMLHFFYYLIFLQIIFSEWPHKAITFFTTNIKYIFTVHIFHIYFSHRSMLFSGILTQNIFRFSGQQTSQLTKPWNRERTKSRTHRALKWGVWRKISYFSL